MRRLWHFAWQTSILAAFLFSSEAAARNLKIATFNIAWYGLDGSPNNLPEDEHRDPYLKNFIVQYLSSVDIFAFEEIVDLPRLERQVLESKYRCASYDHESPTHQHVALCFKKELSLAKADGDTDYIIEEVALDRYRPAVHGILIDQQRVELAYLVALHLKSGPDNSDIREQQLEILADYLAAHPMGLPTVILGDFNTTPEDVSLFNKIFREHGLQLVEARNNYSFTFRNANTAKKFDRLWLGATELQGTAKVFGPCNSTASAKGNGFENLAYYNKNVSDHCPVTIDIALPAK